MFWKLCKIDVMYTNLKYESAWNIFLPYWHVLNSWKQWYVYKPHESQDLLVISFNVIEEITVR
jgi:hypothetical protein